MNRIAWLLLSIALVTLVPACAGVSLVIEEPTPTPTPVPPTATATPIPPTATATRVPPTATSAAPPTEVPTSTPVPDQVVTQATGACAHPYYPVRSDTTWNYQTQTGGAEPSEYAVTFNDIGANAFTSRQTFPGSSTEAVWLCGDEGLLPTEVASFMFFQMPGFEFETVDSSGALLPAPEAWEVGATWETKYTVEATTKVLGLSIKSLADISINNEIADTESVVVPADSYDNVTRIDSTGTALINAPGTQMEAPFSFSHWYVEGVGLVKISAVVQGTSFEMELVSVEQ